MVNLTFPACLLARLPEVRQAGKTAKIKIPNSIWDFDSS